MKGQTKALIPALIGIAILLLTGISGVFLPTGERPATSTMSQAAGPEQGQREILSAAIRSEANTAALQAYRNVAADIATDLQRPPKYMISKAGM